MQPKTEFEKYFTIETAVKMLPFVKKTFQEAYEELGELQDNIVLYKRMSRVNENELDESKPKSRKKCNATQDLVQYKCDEFEVRFHHWIQIFMDEGILVKDFKKGLIDFPYKAKDGTEYLLCWHLGEEGLFYFHDMYEGFGGRKPISLLPE